MYNIRQFKPALYTLVFLGMVGFAMASQTAAAWLIGCGGVLLNAWLVKTGNFRPVPRPVANVLTVACLAYVVRQLTTGSTQNVVLVLGQFLVVLQLVKIWEQRANRDFAQLIVLSLLLMVAAAINTSTLSFGLLLLVYLFLSLYCCLLFHLKVETDRAKAALAIPEEKVSPAILRQDQRHLSRSMWRLTGLVSSAAITMAVIVFIAFPRGAGQNVLGGFQMAPAQMLTGFTEEVSLTDVTRISQNEAVVARVELFHDNQRVEGTMPLLLRGQVLDRYHSDGGAGQWRAPSHEVSALPKGNATGDELLPLPPYGRPARWRQNVVLYPTGTRTIFAVATPTAIKFRRDLQVRVFDDGVIQSDGVINSPLEYEVYSSGEPDATKPPNLAGRRFVDDHAPIANYALRPEVSGIDELGPLGERRKTQAEKARKPIGDLPASADRPVHPLDEIIAGNIERHLKGPEFSYTLDTTDAKNRSGQDPYIWFLSPDGHRGHCEYFAGAMVLMCQSLGMNARMVTGFKCDDYNSTGSGYYIVRQSHAHAWVEVLTLSSAGSYAWKTFDPTSGREDNRSRQGAGWWTTVKHFFDYLEYSYANHVIAYDNENRENLIQAVEARMTAPVYRGINSRSFGRAFAAFEGALERITESVANVAIVVGLFAAAGGVGWILWQQRKLRLRAKRIGIKSLPAGEQLRLARQLKFYDDLIRLLAKHRITRPPHLTPMEFARSLIDLPADVGRAILRLTDIFYDVRFGLAELTPGQHRHLANAVARVETSLATRAAPKTAVGQ